MVLVTGAAGKTGRAVIEALVRRGAAVRALVRRQSQAEAVEALGAREAVAGDMAEPAVWRQALAAVEAVYHICPNMHPAETAIGRAAIAAARASGVNRFIYHSVMHPQTEKMPHHWQKLRVEEALLESGLEFTILQPAVYMQNVLAGRDSIVNEGVYRVPYPVETRINMVDLADVAEAAAVVLTETGHGSATYELAGPEALTQVEAAALLAGAWSRPVRAVQITTTEWRRQARCLGLGSYQIETLLGMFDYYARFGFAGSGNILHWLLGRPPTTFAAWCRSAAQQR